MFTLLRSVLPTFSGLVLLSLFVWIAGPLFAFAGYQPFATATVRLVVIALVWVGWAGWIAVKRLRTWRAANRLATAVVQQSRAGTEPTADVVQLREGFEQALQALTDKKRGRGLYTLPWYVIIGAPGSGKSTVLMNSGLHFPLEQRTGRHALRGIGGTRNCDWWFTDEAVFLDTAGRYTTQDSDAGADAEGWKAFLGLLRRHRRRQPINGVILAISAQDLMTQVPGAPDPHVEAARRRLVELNREFRIQVPVYVLVTKCDLVAGFTEYFDDLVQDGRAQPWGVTFAIEQTRQGTAAGAFPAEFDALVERLNARVLARLEDERDPRRRARVFGFPQQVAALRGALTSYVAEVFSATRFDHPVLLRGVYFTSGTQEGTPIDRLLAALSRRFAIAAEAVPAAPPGRGKAYFVTRVLHEVIFAESGLAGVDRRFEAQWAAAQVGVYAAIAAILVVACVLGTVSYSRNRTYVDEVGILVDNLKTVPPVAETGSLDDALPRLRAVRAVVESADRYDPAPWSMSWGLFQGDALAEAAQDAYARELRVAMLPHVVGRFRQRLVDYAAEPEKLYPYLKGYLMLGQPEYLDPRQLEYLAGLEWEAAYPNDVDRAAEMTEHFANLIAFTRSFPPQDIDDPLIEQVRTSLQRAAPEELVYRYIRIDYARDTQRALRLDQAIGLGAERVLRRSGRVALSEPIASIYTKPVFQEITGRGIAAQVGRFTAESWVWGDKAPAVTGRVSEATVLKVYESDYIREWDRIVSEIDAAPLTSLSATKEAIAILGGGTSPLRNFLAVVREHTLLIEPDEPSGSGIIDRVGTGLENVFEQGRDRLGMPSTKPGARITERFAPLHRQLGTGDGPAPIDGVIQKLQELSGKLQPIGDEVGATAPADAGAISSVGQTATELQRVAAPLPAGLGEIVSDVANGAMSAVRGGVRTSLQTVYEQNVVRECRDLIKNGYPFVPDSGTDVPLADFGALFGYGGVYDRFFQQHLANLVDVARTQWAWRTDAAGAAVGGSPAILRQFQAADAIRRAFFRAGSQEPQLRFVIHMPELDSTTLRFMLTLDGQPYQYAHGPDEQKPMRWPGTTPGPAVATFDGGGIAANLAFEGPWAWFRLLDSARVEPESDTAYVYRLESEGRWARLRVVADSNRNPFGTQLLRQFRCD